jgi:glycosyltransferase involved in cell wall biosynthesis
MKIVHIIATLDPAAGGPPAVAMRLAAAQAALGHDVTIGAHDPGQAREKVKASIAEVPGIDRVNIIELPRGGGLDRITAASAESGLNGCLDGRDFLHLHGVWEPILLRASKIARRKHIAYTVTPHGMLDPWSLQQRALKKKIALALGYRSMLRGVGFLHLLNQDEESLIEPLGLNCVGEVIPNGMFLEEVDPLPAPGGFYNKHPELDGKPFVLFLSRLHYKKGLDYLADSFSKVAKADDQTRLVVAGPDGGVLAEFEQLIKNHGLADRTHVVGPIYGQDKLELIVDAACFCLPSRQEGFSMAITEAMACRLPVIISRNCHFPEVEEVGAGCVVDLQASHVADALKRVLGDEILRKNMGEAGRQLIEQRFTWSKVAELALTTYQKAIDRAG